MTYFSNSGLTATSANYIANKAKEFYNTLETELDNVNFITTSVSTVGSGQSAYLTIGNSLDFLTTYKEKVEKIQQAKSLIAYLREAIKEKDRLLKEAETYQLEELQVLEHPTNVIPLTEEQLIEQMSIKDKAHYLSLETYCSTIGKFIHPNRSLSNARKALHKLQTSASKLEEVGNTCVIYTYKPSISIEEVDRLFFQLQELHRNYQAELNGIKHTIKLKAEEEALKAREHNELIMQEFNDKRIKLLTKQADIREQKAKEVRNLKIQIPNSLKDIYNEIKSL